MKKKEQELVVIVLLNYNQNDYTIKCIESLLHSEYDNYKILLIDNGSTEDNFQELKKNLPDAEELEVKRIEDNIGYGGGTNYGLAEGKKHHPDFFLIMNNDTIIDKLAIKEMVKTCNDYEKKALVIGKVYHYDDPNRLQLVGYQYKNKKYFTYSKMGYDQVDNGQFDRVEERVMIDDIFVLHPVNLYDTVGGYSPYFWINGVNVDLAFRAIKKGFKLVYTPHAKLWHKGSVSIGGRDKNPKLAYYGIQSSLILRYLYLSKFTFLFYYLKLLFQLFRSYIKTLYYKVFKGVDNRKHAYAKFRALLYFNKWVIKKNHHTGYNPY